MKRRYFLEYSFLFLAGCTAAKTQPNQFFSNSQETWPQSIRFAVTDLQGLEELQRDYEVFRQTLEKVLECSIEFFPVSSYTAAAVALQSKDVDLVFTGPSEYVVIHARTNSVPVIAVTRPNYHSLIVVAAQNKIQSLPELKGKTIGMLNIGSTSGHLGPTKILMQAGLNPLSDYQVKMLGNNNQALEALGKGEIDAWAGPAHRYESFLKESGSTVSEFPIIAEGESLPSDVFVANSHFSKRWVEEMRSRMVAAQDQLISALLSSPENQKYQNSTFVPANDRDYDMIREVYQAIGQGSFIR